MTPVLLAVDRPVLIAFGFVVLLIILGGLYNPQFLSAFYLLQQLQVASFLGIIASGLMVVILLGHIDLSIPWVVTIGGMTATAAAGWWGEEFAWSSAVKHPCGSYPGTVAGVILITVLDSILSVAQIPEAARQIIYGAIIIGMMLVYGRARRTEG